ncbi:MAG: hypothetical protein AB8G11_11150 [Saprospiraceae bacterium]
MDKETITFLNQPVRIEKGMVVNYSKEDILSPVNKELLTYQKFINQMATAIWKGKIDLKWKNEYRKDRNKMFFEVGVYRYIFTLRQELNIVSFYVKDAVNKYNIKHHKTFSVETFQSLESDLTECFKADAKKANVELYDEDVVVKNIIEKHYHEAIVKRQWFDGLNNPDELMGSLKEPVIDLDDLVPTSDELKSLERLGYTFSTYEQLLKDMPNFVVTEDCEFNKYIVGYKVWYSTNDLIVVEMPPFTKRKISGVIGILVWIKTVTETIEKKNGKKSKRKGFRRLFGRELFGQ